MMNRRFSLLFVVIMLAAGAACQPATPAPTPTPRAQPPATQPATPLPPTSSPPAKGTPIEINGFLKPYGADGANWPPNEAVTVRLYDKPQGQMLYTGQATTDASGHFYLELGVATQPGMQVTVSDGHDTESVVLVPVAVTAFDLAHDTVSGTALPGAPMLVHAGDGGQMVTLTTAASAAGQWQADFAGRLDLTDSATVQAVVLDANGNGTAYKTPAK